jgi:hypothetical protein
MKGGAVNGEPWYLTGRRNTLAKRRLAEFNPYEAFDLVVIH